MDWPTDKSAWNQDDIYYGYHSADPSPLVPLPYLGPDINLGSLVDGEHHWGCYCFLCRPVSVNGPAMVTGNGPTPANPNQIAAISAFDQPPLESSISKEQEPVSQKKKKNTTQPPAPVVPLQCKWEGCRYSGSFNREHELIRHLRNTHFARGAYPCPVHSCGKVCNRRDNLLQHIKNRHRPETSDSGFTL